ncbi:transposase [Bradyrhizobium diazoefficiens]
MIPEAREVHLSRKDRKVLEACCRSPVTLQRDLKRARIVLLAADGRSTRSIAKEVGVQPRIVSLWRHRYADHGLEGLQDKPRPGKQPIYTKTTDKRILKLLDKPPPQGFARWTGPLLAEALGDVDVRHTLAVDSHLPPTLRGHNLVAVREVLAVEPAPLSHSKSGSSPF